MTGLYAHATRYSNAFSKKGASASNQMSGGTNSSIGADAFAGMLPDSDELSVFS